jgi:hypothetical protein
MIIAMGLVNADGTLVQGYNITNCELDPMSLYYRITLTGISYHWDYYVTIVTPYAGSTHLHASFGHDMQSFDLVVSIFDNSNQTAQGGFSFMVLDTTP